MTQNFDLGLSYDLMSKTSNLSFTFKIREHGENPLNIA